MSEHGRLHIAMVAPPWFDVPPVGYGGIERVVGDLTGALVAAGHRVTLIGAGRDNTPATMLATYDEPPSERLGEPIPEVVHAAATMRLLAELDVDVVHDHSLAGPLTAAARAAPTVATMHGPAEGDFLDYYRELGDAVSLVAISEAQRVMAPELNWVSTVYNGVDVDSFPLRRAQGGLGALRGKVLRRQGTGPGHRRGPGGGTGASSWPGRPTSPPSRSTWSR